MNRTVWYCKIGGPVMGLPQGADYPMRKAVEAGFTRPLILHRGGEAVNFIEDYKQERKMKRYFFGGIGLAILAFAWYFTLYFLYEPRML